MGKKYFVVSDIHSFYNELMTGLIQAGYNKRNKDHVLVVNGDIFDRGPDAVKVYKFLSKLPKSRCILVRGNHEYLYLELLKKSFPESHDFHNRTVETFCQIAGVEIDGSVDQWKKICEAVNASPITEWLRSDRWQNYFELDKFVFVHSFIPTNLKQSAIDEFGLRAHMFENPEYYEYDPEWRNEKASWDKAIWGCPFTQYQAGLFNEDKTLVVGHWHTGDFFRKLKQIHIYDHDCGPIYYSKGLIGIDGGCMYDPYYEEYIHPQNVLVIDENNICYDKYGEKLVEPKAKIERIIKTVSIDKNGNEIVGSDDFLEK